MAAPTLTITVTVPGVSAGSHKAVANDFLQAMGPDIKAAVAKALGTTSSVPADAIKVSMTFS
jgi:hypothetical protein